MIFTWSKVLLHSGSKAYRPIVIKLTAGLGMSNMNFLIEDMTLFLLKTKITFSQRDETKIKSQQFSVYIYTYPKLWKHFGPNHSALNVVT